MGVYLANFDRVLFAVRLDEKTHGKDSAVRFRAFGAWQTPS
jgi:hypothetical protein